MISADTRSMPMSKGGRFVAALSLALLLCTGRAEAFSELHRGVALFHPMAAASLTDGSHTDFLPAPFSGARHLLTNAQLDVLANAGFDFVRLPVDPSPLLAFRGVERDALDEVLRRNVRMILARGIAVIVDFHPSSWDTNYTPDVLLQGADTPIFDAYCAMLARTANLLASLHSDRVALEVMNEPYAGDDFAAFARRWQGMEEKAYAGIRAAAPALPLVLTGAHGNYQGLIVFDARPFAKDPNVVFTFHYYDPLMFTHQSLPTNPQLRIAADIPYPANARGQGENIAALQARIDRLDTNLAARAIDFSLGVVDLVRYRNADFNRQTMHGDFAKVAAWARTNAIPDSRILLGEFGVIRRYGPYQGALEPDRLRWLKDVREEAEAHGFPWSIWAYSGHGGMEIIANDQTDAIDPPTARALGLGR